MASELCAGPGGCAGLSYNGDSCQPVNAPGNIGPCKVTDSSGASIFGYIGPDGYCCSGDEGDPEPNPPTVCFPGLVLKGKYCYCPDGTNPNTAGKTLEEKCPKKQIACADGTIYDPAQKKCVPIPHTCPQPQCPGCEKCPEPGKPCPEPVTPTSAETEVVSLWPWLVGGTVLGLVTGYLAFSKPGKK